MSRNSAQARQQSDSFLVQLATGLISLAWAFHSSDTGHSGQSGVTEGDDRWVKGCGCHVLFHVLTSATYGCHVLLTSGFAIYTKCQTFLCEVSWTRGVAIQPSLHCGPLVLFSIQSQTQYLSSDLYFLHSVFAGPLKILINASCHTVVKFSRRVLHCDMRLRLRQSNGNSSLFFSQMTSVE